jgi:hypothetical protein
LTGPKKVTAKQLAANRRNAQKSTGPRTAQGKAISRWNALKHGVLSRALIPPALEPYESRVEFDALLETLRQELDPRSALEEMLVERIATSYWRLARLLRAEAAEIAQRLDSCEEDLHEQKAWAKAMKNTSLTPWPDDLGDRVRRLARAQGSVTELRQILVKEDARWADAPRDELLQAGEELLEELQQAQADKEARELEAARDARSIPDLDRVVRFARYETTLERQIYRALDALERIQRLRGGERLPAPLKVDLTTDGE